MEAVGNRRLFTKAIETIFMLTSEENRIFSVDSLRNTLGPDALSALEPLIGQGFISRVSDRYYALNAPRLRLLSLAGEGLIHPHVDDLSWSEFEEFVSFTLRQMGYRTINRVRVTMGDVRGELDVVGYRGGVFLIIEAKHWLTISRGELEAIVDKHLVKVEALAKNWVSFLRKVKVNAPEATLYPIVVTLRQPQVEVYRGVPIVASYKLPNFMENINALMDNMVSFKARAPHL